MPEVLGVQLAPLFVPMNRRLQTLAVLFYTSMFVFIPIATSLFCILLLFTPLAFVTIGYFIWIFYDYKIKEVSCHGGRRREWMRRSKHMEYFRDYFPITLNKTADLDPTKNYVMGYHPHGIIGCGAFCNFASEATGFSEKFPGVTPHLLTLRANFMWPITRMYTLSMGICDVSKDSIQWILTKQGQGNAAIVVIGGAEESLEAHEGTYNLTLKKRKGFVKIAIKTGASLVPIFSFGENDLFHQTDNPHGSKLRAFQEYFKKTFGFAPPLFHGRGVFNYSFGLLPYRHRVDTVVGVPIDTEQCDEPTQDMIDKYHQKYMDGLARVFDENKMKYGIPKDKHITFI